jgi:hypothetical protein
MRTIVTTMKSLRPFEIEVLRILLAEVLTDVQWAEVENYSGKAVYEYTGSGYFLTLPISDLPQTRRTFSEPAVAGEAEGVNCGFVAYLENGNVLLECHSWGEIDVPEGFRELNVQVSTPDVRRVGGPWSS